MKIKIKSRSEADQKQIKGFPAKAGPALRAVLKISDRSHAPRGNASRDAPRHFHGLNVRRLRDAERPGRHSHAERGNDQYCVTAV